MTPDEFIAESNAIGLALGLPITGKMGGTMKDIAVLEYDEKFTGVQLHSGIVLAWGTTIGPTFSSVRAAVIDAIERGEFVPAGDPIVLAEKLSNHQREDEGPRGS